MANIDFVVDYNGEQQALDFIFTEMVEMAKKDPDYANIVYLITQALDRIEIVGLMPEDEFFTGKKLDDTPYTFRPLMKSLDHQPNEHLLYELRINYKRVAAFRAIFFIRHPEEGETFYFTRALLKQEEQSPEFNKAFRESQRIVSDFESSVERGDSND